MLVIKPRLRIVKHYLDKKNPYKKHGDLFIELPKYDKLITFEIESYYLEFLKKQYKYYYLLTQDKNLLNYISNVIPVLSSKQDIYNKHHNCDFITVQLKRKEDHRKDYMQIEGDIDHKGKVENFTISYISGIIFDNIDALIIVDYD